MGGQAKFACVNLQVCAGLMDGIEIAAHTVQWRCKECINHSQEVVENYEEEEEEV